MDGLKARGHEARLICPPGSLIQAEAIRRGVPVVALPIARKRPVGVKVLYEWFKRNRCDVVCTHGSTDAWLAALALIALGRPFPMVYAPHLAPAPAKNAATRWLHKRASARVVGHSALPENALAEEMEKIYLQVRR